MDTLSFLLHNSRDMLDSWHNKVYDSVLGVIIWHILISHTMD